MASMQGHPLREIAEDLGYSESTAHRRIKEAREQLRGQLVPRGHERPWVSFEKAVDPVLERSQRLFELTFEPLNPPDPGRAPSR